MDITRAPSVKKVKKNDSANFNIADIMACHGISMPTCACPYENCDFVSKNMFIGVRIHLVKHFTKEIRAVAMPKMKTNPMANYQAKDNSFQCMSGWNCSIPNLESRGELVSHYGLLHCYVDLFFRQYLELWLSTLPPSCPFDSYQYVDVVDYIRHLTDSHFYTAIEVEVGEMVHWKAGLAEYKCPYCVMKFPVRTLEGGERDLGDLVEHCGLLHNFSLYYLQQGYPPAGVKQEMGLKQEGDELEPLLNIPVKTELLEEGEPIVFQENPVKLEPETSCIDVKEEPVEAGDDIAATEAPVLADIRDLSKLTVEELEQVYMGLGQGTPLGGRGAMVSLLVKSRNLAYRLDVEGWNRRFMEKKRQILEKKQQQQQTQSN